MQWDDNIEDLLKILNIFNNRLTELHWFYSPFHFMDSKVDFQKICKMRSDDRKPVFVLDRNIFSRLINVVSKGKTDEGSTKDIAILVAWSALNNVNILPYYALNEFAEGNNCEMAAQREYGVFKKIFTDITLLEWLALALGLEEENKTLVNTDENIEQIETLFCNTSIDYLSNYAAMLHLSSVLLSEKEQISKFKSFFEWFYSSLKVSRYTVVYVCRLLLGNIDYKEPKKIHGKNIDKAIKGCQNQARDLSYLTQLSIDRWPIEQYEPILITDDQMLGDIFVNGCFNTQPIRQFERNIKTSSRKTTEWVDELLENHKEIEVDDYEIYCRNVIEQELDMFRKIFISKNDYMDNK
jgi:hypothetical protein